MRMPGVQNPHWSAWCRRNASCSGVSGPVPASPSTVTTSLPSTCSREEQARAHRHAVQLHRACAAHTMLAADMRPGEAEAVPEEVGEKEARVHLLAVAAAVHRDVDGDHAACSLARATTRSTRTRTRWRR